MSSFPRMAKIRKWIVGGERGGNGLLYVCLMTWSNKERPQPQSPKACGNVSNIKRGTLPFLVMLLVGRVMNLGNELCFFRTMAK